jgi:hypothetical protein
MGDSTGTGATWVFARSGTGWSQQGPKLVGTGAAGSSVFQGRSLALSADGTTLAVGGYGDNGNIGATWVFSTASSLLAPRAASGPRTNAGFFPNPVTEQITLLGGGRAGTLRLLDGQGRTVLAGAYHDGQRLDLSALTAGLYWLQLDQTPARALFKH